MWNKTKAAASVLFGLGISLAGVPAQAIDVTGAGASFPAPVYAKWADTYQKETGNRINYQSIGSGGGIKQIVAKTVDFGASDMPLKPEALEKDGLTQFPAVIGGVVPVINISGINPGEIRLTGQVLADIYLGKVMKWNDPAIVALNPQAASKLPTTDIAVVRRADASGTSFLFTNYLSKVNPQWKEQVGEGSMVQWPVGMGGKGNEGVAAFVQRLPHSIGYVEYAYAKQNKLSHVLMQNSAGEFVSPGDASFKAAAAGADWSKGAFGEVLTDQPGKEVWPLTGATFILMRKTSVRAEAARETLKFFDWAFRKGAAQAAELDYVSLPDDLTQSIRASWAREIKDEAGKALWQ